MSHDKALYKSMDTLLYFSSKAVVLMRVTDHCSFADLFWPSYIWHCTFSIADGWVTKLSSCVLVSVISCYFYQLLLSHSLWGRRNTLSFVVGNIVSLC